MEQASSEGRRQCKILKIKWATVRNQASGWVFLFRDAVAAWFFYDEESVHIHFLYKSKKVEVGGKLLPTELL